MRFFWIPLLLAVWGVSRAESDGAAERWQKTDLDLKISRLFLTNEKCQSTPDYLASCMEAIAAANKHLLEPVEVVDRDFEKAFGEIRDKLPVLVPAQRMLADAINAHLTHFDAHAYLAPADTFDGPKPYRGFGLFMRKVKRGFFVTEVVDGSPAAHSGMRFGDLITGMNAMERAQFLALDSKQFGELLHDASAITLAVERNGNAFETKLTPGPVDLKTVSSAHFRGENAIGYIRIREFVKGHTCSEFKRELKELEQEGAAKFVIDLRDNPGGTTGEAVCIAGIFLGFAEVAGLQRIDIAIPEDTLIQAPGEIGDIRWLRGLGVFMDISPLAVLVNERTGSAAEILAGGLLAQNRAWLVGRRTWGKGSQQTYATIENHPSLIVAATSDRVLLPNMQSHQKVGLPVSFTVDLTANPDSNDALEEESEALKYPRSLAPLNEAWEDSRKDEISEIERCVNAAGLDKALAKTTGGDLQKAYGAAVLKCF